MKNSILVMALLISLTAIAQPSKLRHKKHKTAYKMSAEQLATLKTKKMTLALVLTAKQQQEVLKINLEEAKFRKAKIAERKEIKEDGEYRKLTSDEKFELRNAILDRRIAHQEKLKKILSDSQFNLWKKGRNQKGIHGKKKMQRDGRRG